MMKHQPSPNFDDRASQLDMLILHYTGLPTLEDSLARLCDPASKVSAHYLIDEAGEVFSIVPEAKRAWHAGKSFWAGETDINSASIGIELQNPGHEFGYRPFPAAQIESLMHLCKDIIERHNILAKNILGHSDVAPQRKQDPGELFPWQTLAGEGIGVWPGKLPEVQSFDEQTIRKMFTRFGYNPADSLGDIITAFQRHWYPENITGETDIETLARLKVLL